MSRPDGELASDGGHGPRLSRSLPRSRPSRTARRNQAARQPRTLTDGLCRPCYLVDRLQGLGASAGAEGAPAGGTPRPWTAVAWSTNSRSFGSISRLAAAAWAHGGYGLAERRRAIAEQPVDDLVGHARIRVPLPAAAALASRCRLIAELSLHWGMLRRFRHVAGCRNTAC